MKSPQNALVIFLLIVGLACLGLGIYSLARKSDSQIVERVVYVTPSPKLEVQPKKRQEPIKKPLSESTNSIVVNGNGSWTVIVPAIAKGVTLETDTGHRFEVTAGDELEITATGKVDIGRGAVGPDGEQTGYWDTSVDSPFHKNVGGLEMWIGPDKTANRYFVGANFRRVISHSGVLTLRVIESLHGYTDGNSGAFTVTVTKR